MRRTVKWSMANNIVAFVGLESFDIILYLSRIMQSLGRKILVVDNSENKALTYSVPHIDWMNTLETIISNRRVDFTGMSVTGELATTYDDVLVDCGCKPPVTSIGLFTKIIYVTDMFEYNIRRIAQINYYQECKCEVSLLIRDLINTKITVEHIVEGLGKEIPEDMISVLYRDDNDYENCLNSHINQVFTLNLSRLLKGYLMEQISNLCPQVTLNDIKEAYKKARKGD